jgi:polar amino acid transport system permease protein
VHETYGFFLAVLTFAIVFGAFAANVLFGAMRAVPRAQMETAEAYGMTQRQAFWRILVPQMWVYALPGLSNLWMILIKATPLLFLLGVEDIVYWARELGGSKSPLHRLPAWRLADVVLPRAAGLLPRLHLGLREGAGPADETAHARPGDGGRRSTAAA